MVIHLSKIMKPKAGNPEAGNRDEEYQRLNVNSLNANKTLKK